MCSFLCSFFFIFIFLLVKDLRFMTFYYIRRHLDFPTLLSDSTIEKHTATDLVFICFSNYESRCMTDPHPIHMNSSNIFLSPLQVELDITSFVYKGILPLKKFTYLPAEFTNDLKQKFSNIYSPSVHTVCTEQNYWKKVLLCFRLRF